jgi:hypothetical protein
MVSSTVFIYVGADVSLGMLSDMMPKHVCLLSCRIGMVRRRLLLVYVVCCPRGRVLQFRPYYRLLISLLMGMRSG